MTAEPTNHTDRRAALRLAIAKQQQALDAADRASHERKLLGVEFEKADCAAAARAIMVAMAAAVDREQAAEDALEKHDVSCVDPVKEPAGGRTSLNRPLLKITLADAPSPEVREARLAGYEGTPCPKCGALSLVRSGERWACEDCNARSEDALLDKGYPASNASETAPPVKQEPPSGLVLPCHRDGDRYVFRDPGDVQIAAACGLGVSFPVANVEGVARHVLKETGRTLMPFDPPQKEKKPRKPRTKKGEGVGPGERPAAEPAPQETPAQEVEQQQEEHRFASVAPGCLLELEEGEGGSVYAKLPADRTHFGNWGNEEAQREQGKLIPCETDIAAAVGGALGCAVKLIGYAVEKGKPSFILRRAEVAEGNGFLPGFAPPAPTAQEGGL